MRAISVSLLRKTYRRFPFRKVVALQDVTFEAPQGAGFALLGANGAGKTTLVKILLGISRQDRGTAEVLGEPVGSARIRRRVGYVPESPYFYDHLTPKEMLNYYAALSEVPSRDRKKRIAEVLETTRISHIADRPLRTFSKGQLQRAGLAQALLHWPELLFLDEPTSGLDPAGRAQMREIIQGLERQGVTIFMNSHLLSEVEQVCTHIAIIKQGRLLVAGALKNLLSATRYEVFASGIPAESLPSLQQKWRVEDVEGGYLVYAQNSHDPNEMLQDILTAGGHILRAGEKRQTLEELYLQVEGRQ